MAQISKQNFQFLKAIAKNNNKAWFDDNRADYETALANIKDFNAELLERMQMHDNIERLKLYRIYRDVRFSKDKTPYKHYWHIGLVRASKQLRGGYFFGVQPSGQSIVGGGFYSPNKEDLKLIRDKIVQDDEPFREVFESQQFKKTFGTLLGQQLKVTPKGFDKEHPAIDLLRYKQMYVMKNFEDKTVLQPNFIDEVVATMLELRPFFDLMSDVLTTDLNGEPLYE